jgi:histidine triad (HIT) family protein
VQKSIFSKIIDGEIPCHKIAENEFAFSFLDVSPATKGHALVVSKLPGPSLHDLSADALAGTMQLVQQVAAQIQRTLHPDGINVLQNNGGAAGQTVFHFHVHIIPRWSGDQALSFWKPLTFDAAELAQLAEQLRIA